MQTSTDVLVIGGGPGGAATSTLLARKGWQVMLLEKDHHPRFHIGESMLPLSMPILKELGVFDDIAQIGVPKHGADFAGPDDVRLSTYYFRDALECQFPYAFEVKREEFDKILFDNATANGVETHEGVKVVDVSWDGAGMACAEVVNEEGATVQIRARYVVDASGRDTLLGNKFKIKQANPHHRSAAIYSHFTGVSTRKGQNAGNIGIYWMPHGWGWIIPLQGGITSVGCVCRPEHLKTRRGQSQEQFLLDTLRATPSMWRRVKSAQRVWPVRMAGNYSYDCTQMGGKGWVLVGDAFSFIDPVFSSGVYLALSSGKRAAVLVDKVLRKPSRERALQRRYERHTRRGLKKFSWFIYKFTSPVTRKLFMAPQNRLQIQQAVTSMLAGDVYVNRAASRRLLLFKVIYRLAGIKGG